MALPSSAQISVVNSFGQKYPDTGTPGSTNLEGVPFDIAFNPGAAADKIVLAYTSEGGNSGTMSFSWDGLVTPLTFTEVAGTATGRTRSTYYLDLAGTGFTGSETNPTITVDLTANDTVNGMGVAIVSLSGTGAGTASTVATASAASVDITPTIDGSFVLASGSKNGSGSASVTSPLTQLYAVGDIGSAAAGAGYDEDVAASLQTYSFGGSVTNTAAAAFEPLPYLLSTNPADDAIGVAFVADLVATFSEDVQAGTGNIALYETSGDVLVETFDVASSPQLTFSGPDVTINPTNDLSSATEYYILIDASAIDDANTGNDSFPGISSTTAWSFTSAAAFSVVNSGSHIDGSIDASAGGKTIQIDAGAAADLLVVGTSTEFGTGTIGGWSVTYDGNPMTFASGNGSQSNVFYLDLTGTSYSGGDADLVFAWDYTAGGDLGVGWVSTTVVLDPGESVALHSTGDSGGSTSVDLVTTVDDTFNFVNFNSNKIGGTDSVDPPLIEIYADSEFGSNGGGAGYESNVAAGTNTYSWSPGGAGRRNDAVAFFVANPYEAWVADFPGLGVDTDPSDNPDGDSLSNLLEFSFGTDPTVSDASSLIWSDPGFTPGTPIIDADFSGGSGVDFTARFIRRLDHGSSGSVDYAWQFSSNLSDWESSDNTPGWLVAPIQLATDGDYELLEIPYPFFLDNFKKARFFRVEVTEVP